MSRTRGNKSARRGPLSQEQPWFAAARVRSRKRNKAAKLSRKKNR